MNERRNMGEGEGGVTLREFLLSQITALREFIEQRLHEQEKALELQATENLRRLEVLNGERELERSRSATFVTQERFEDAFKAAEQARETALTRTNEKFEDYVRRYELRQREIDQALAQHKASMEQSAAIQAAAAAATQKAVDEASHEQQRLSDTQTRRTNRNLALMSLALAFLVAASNYLSSH